MIQGVYLNEEQLIRYLEEYGPRFPSKRLPTDYEEIVIAIWTKRILEAETGKRFLIAFELKAALDEIMPHFDPNSPSNIKELFKKYVEKNTVIDFALTTERSGKHKTSFAFQLKIIDLPLEDIEKNLAEEINRLLNKKYPKLSQDISLIIVPQVKSNISLESSLRAEVVKKKITPKRHTFEKIFIFWAKGHYKNLTEIYPGLNNSRTDVG